MILDYTGILFHVQNLPYASQATFTGELITLIGR